MLRGSISSPQDDFSQFDDATVIGPSASQDRIRRQDLFENVEPDFVLGGSEDEDDEDLEEDEEEEEEWYEEEDEELW